MRLSQKSIIPPEDLGSRILHVVTWRLLERIRPKLEATEKHTGRQFNSTSKMEERKENDRKKGLESMSRGDKARRDFGMLSELKCDLTGHTMSCRIFRSAPTSMGPGTSLCGDNAV